MKKDLIRLCLGTTASMLVASATANAITLSYGNTSETISAQELTSGNFNQHSFSVDATGTNANAYRLTLETSSSGGSTPDTELGLYDSNDQLLANDDDGGAGFFSQIVHTDAPGTTPDYTAVVGGYNTNFASTGSAIGDISVGSSSSSGFYDLNLGVELLNVSNTFETFSGAIGSNAYNTYEFSVDAGSTGFNIAVISDDSITGLGILDSEIGVYDSAGNLVAHDDLDGPGYLSELSFGNDFLGNGSDGVLAEGLYTLIVGGWNTTFGTTLDDIVVSTNSADSTGGYTIELVGVTATAAAPVPEPSTYAMFGTAFAILGFVGYRSRNRKS